MHEHLLHTDPSKWHLVPDQSPHPPYTMFLLSTLIEPGCCLTDVDLKTTWNHTFHTLFFAILFSYNMYKSMFLSLDIQYQPDIIQPWRLAIRASQNMVSNSVLAADNINNLKCHVNIDTLISSPVMPTF